MRKIISVILDLVNASYNRKMKESHDATKGFATKSKAALGSMVAAWGKVAVVVGAAYGLYRMILKPAMDAEEAASKFNTIFGANANQITSWADRAATAMNRSSRELQGMAADVMALVSPMAATREAALSMSTGAVQAAEDLGSFNNVPVADALLAIRSGLTGEAEPLKRFGIQLSEAALQEYAFAQGIRKKVSEMSTAEKLQLRYNAILSQMGAAQGDAARTSGSLTNTLKGIQATLADNAVELGSRMVPGLTRLATAFKMSLDRGGPLTDVLNAMASGVNSVAEAVGDNLIEGMRLEDLRNEMAQVRDVTYTAIDAQSGMQDQASAMLDATIRVAGAERSRYRQLQLLIAEYQNKLNTGSIENSSQLRQVTTRLAELREELGRLPAPIESANGAMTFSLNQVLAGINQVQTAQRRQPPPGGWQEDPWAKAVREKNEGMSKLIISDQEYAAQSRAIDDENTLARLENQEKERANHEKVLRSKVGMESQTFQAMQMFANMGQALMQSKNKGIFRMGQALAISNSIISAAEAVMKGMSYGPFVGIPYAAMVGTALAIQLAKIKSQKPPEMAVGTWQVPQDMTATIHRGEQIIPRPMAEAVRSGDAALVGAGGGGGQSFVLQIDGVTLGEILDGHRARKATNMGVRDYAMRSVYR